MDLTSAPITPYRATSSIGLTAGIGYLANLEFHAAHACNLKCESCSHYSNHGHIGIVSLEEARAWMEPWRTRLSPALISIMGGEPAIHPRLAELIEITRKNWPSSHLRLVSNGFLLHRHPNLPEVLARTGTEIHLSIHHGSPTYTTRLEPVYSLLRTWARRYPIRVRVLQSYKNWTRRYHGFGQNMRPFNDAQPRASWEHCTARGCSQLYQGALWKCSPLAYLPLQAAKYNLGAEWSPYLKYRPLHPNCSNAELIAWLRLEDESYCQMCPAHPEVFSPPMPMADAPISVEMGA